MLEGLFNYQDTPLAAVLRPQTLAEVVGQKKLIAILQRMKRPQSLLFYGPPGCGKTTIARILSGQWNYPFRSLSAVSSGVKEIKKVIEEGKKLGKVILFLDEIHRFSSAQQDSLLEAVENGTISLIGATTENPGFRINRALISRMNVYKFEPLTENELTELLERGLKRLSLPFSIPAEVQTIMLKFAGGDARRLLAILESLEGIEEGEDLAQRIDNQIQDYIINYDRKGEHHYDFISAYIKSIRGSDPDAAIYYLACMLEGGEDPLFIGRRLVILASEDIGNASVRALTLATSAMTAIEKIGMPESTIILAHVTTYLASCPKSNASYRAIKEAGQYVRRCGSSVIVPDHLRNAPTAVHRREGAAQGYQYPHDYENNFIVENYFPDALSEQPPQFYYADGDGQERTIRERLAHLWKNVPYKDYDRQKQQ